VIIPVGAAASLAVGAALGTSSDRLGDAEADGLHAANASMAMSAQRRCIEFSF
jgi:hypothetical protein